MGEKITSNIDCMVPLATMLARTTAGESDIKGYYVSEPGENVTSGRRKLLSSSQQCIIPTAFLLYFTV